MQACDPARDAGPAPLGTERLRRRSDFLRTAGGRKAHAALFTLQMRPQDAADRPRVGLTVTKKTGGAVERNRIRRRLREVLRLTPELGLRPRHDYVIVARDGLLLAPFASIAASLALSVAKVHDARPARRPRP